MAIYCLPATANVTVKRKMMQTLCQLVARRIVAEYGPRHVVAYYERPWNKQFRQWYAGQGIEWDKLTTRQMIKTTVGRSN
jgi:hypothetical protein